MQSHSALGSVNAMGKFIAYPLKPSGNIAVALAQQTPIRSPQQTLNKTLGI
jgi:hypothetical protein